MKVSYNWLKQYIKVDLPAAELSEILTNCGLEVSGVEKFETVKGGLKGIIVGEVMTCEKHANADKLSVTTVNIGEENLLPIVCGAPNVAKGQKVLVATVGTTLYSGDDSFEIKKAKIRGEVSEGMICAEDELGLGNSHDGIMVLDPLAVVGTPAAKLFDIEEDVVFEIDLTPNRSDATSHIGVARDIAAALNREKNTNQYKITIPSVDDFKTDNQALTIPIEVKDNDACPRYTGITISNVKIKESPDWLKNRLNAIGLRPINNVVDITNYVLMEAGQPLHAFDADKIKGGKVIVQKLKEGTPFITLDEEERKLSSKDLMICNETEGMCIAGVFGGLGSGITNETKNIFLESAYFDPTHVRKTSKFHGLKTDASFRFERGADPNITIWALKRACNLFKELAGGEISSEIIDVYPKPVDKWTIDFKWEYLDRLSGQPIEKDIAKSILINLGIEILEENDEEIKVLVPTFKVDVKRPADLVEEILRIYGYNNINFPEKVVSSLNYRQKPDMDKFRDLVSDLLSANGFTEIMNNSLTKQEYYEKAASFEAANSVHILNPISRDLNVMRQTLLFGGLESVIRNLNHQHPDLKFYEFGKEYKLQNKESEIVTNRYSEELHLMLLMSGLNNVESWAHKTKKCDFYSLHGEVQSIFSKLGVEFKQLTTDTEVTATFEYGVRYMKGNQVVASLGAVNNKLLKQFDIKQEVFYADINWNLLIDLVKSHKVETKPLPKFPTVRRDLALVVDKAVAYGEIEKLAFQYERNLLKSVGLFDIYEGEKIEQGKKSYAISFILQDENKTLTDKVIEKTMNKLTRAFEEKLGAKLR